MASIRFGSQPTADALASLAAADRTGRRHARRRGRHDLGTMASVFFAIYFDVIGMTKEAFRASMTAILVALSVVRGLGYWAVGEYSRDVLLTVAIALPMMLAGIYIGNRIHTGISELAFRRLVSGALMVSGAALLDGGVRQHRHGLAWVGSIKAIQGDRFANLSP